MLFRAFLNAETSAPAGSLRISIYQNLFDIIAALSIVFTAVIGETGQANSAQKHMHIRLVTVLVGMKRSVCRKCGGFFPVDSAALNDDRFVLRPEPAHVARQNVFAEIFI